MLVDNFTIERLVISNTDMTEAGFTAVVAVLREGNNTVRELSIGSQLLRSREVIVHSVLRCAFVARSHFLPDRYKKQNRRPVYLYVDGHLLPADQCVCLENALRSDCFAHVSPFSHATIQDKYS